MRKFLPFPLSIALSFSVLLALTGCGVLALDGQVQTATPAPRATLPPTAGAPAPTATTPPQLVLPAPVYFISAQNNQLWRVERDGQTLTQITHEQQDVLSFAISPADGALAYVSNNMLIRADAQGGQRQVLVQGPYVEANDIAANFTTAINSPLWSPDGRTLAFGQGGVNLIAADGQTPARLLLASAPYPVEGQPIPDNVIFYQPVSIAPNGQWLLVNVAYYPSGGSPQLVSLTGDPTPIRLNNPDGGPCCTLAWSPDSARLYQANDELGMFATGLWQLDVPGNEFKTLVRGYTGDNNQPLSADQSFHFVNYPFEAGGQVYALAATRPATDEAFQTRTLLTLARITPDGQIQPLRTDLFPVGGAIGAPDGSGALIVDTSMAANLYTTTGRFRWLPGNGQPAIEIPADGRAPAWGQ